MTEARPGDEPAKAETPTQKLTLPGTLRDMALERNPELRPALAWFRQEAGGLKQGWKLFVVSTLIIAGVVAWGVAHVKENTYAEQLGNSNTVFISSNSFLLGKLSEREDEAKKAKEENLRLTLAHNETKREKDAEIARLTADRNSALQRAAALEALPATAASMFTGTTNLLRVLESSTPMLDLRLNGITVTNNLSVSLKHSKKLRIQVLNRSEVAAEGVVLGFRTPLLIDPTNVIASTWSSEPGIFVDDNVNGETKVLNYWEWRAERPLAYRTLYNAETLEITNFALPVVVVGFEVYALKSKKQFFGVTLTFEN